ncbi:transcriptional regulator with XRE-family HTH domain [Kitasatospora sp. MAP12-15]|uniref:helix-turn-helix domain-containing protein n=1 Tax=unclassified Kitasatospora TaxID=2633591 RepID=UPI002475FBA0|nr:helix-turn-helix transcriptional regulator [Kitasatospora sp. MAP12-44]MDH6114674.1 transcriptional regulator with XRE-family HTH domain [Kitasatospora sp. MAP12-44]
MPPSHRRTAASPRPAAGPGTDFAEALRAAIEASGLSLERIRCQLDARGIRISTTTLSHWRRGRSQPERESSMPAVQLIEEILQLPPSSLSSLIGPPRPRGRWGKESSSRLWSRPLWPAELWPGEPWLAEVAEEFEAVPGDHLERLSVHDLFRFDARRGECITRTGQVVRATANGVDRCLVVYAAEDADAGPPVITALHHARLGRVRTRSETGMVAAELLLDAPLAAGDTAVFEYEVHSAVRTPVTRCGRRFAVPVRQYLLQAQFPPGVTPAYCYRYEGDPAADTDRERRGVRLDTSAAVHALWLDQAPSRVGIRWEWD